MIKVTVDLPEEGPTWPPFSSELIFVERTGAGSQGQVRSIPFFARGIAYDDVVHFRLDREREELVCDGVVRPSGHSTLRILLRDDGAAGRVAALLREFGCEWEVTTIDSHWAVDVPPSTPYAALRQQLVELNTADVIGVEEAAVSAVHSGQLD